jgi:gp30|nr:MAG TPA: thymidylate synthase, flavin-dependent [Caudoviricetes sp.]
MISAKVIADSTWGNNRITTLQLRLPRFILSQLNKHRAFSNNAASSRVIPVAKMIEQVVNDPVIPIHWGANQAGMVADKELSEADIQECRHLWLSARDAAVEYAKMFADKGLHKQVTNRLLEPFMWSDVLITATEWDNFFELRLAHDSQPEMQELATVMKQAIDASMPTSTPFHLPYIRKEEVLEWPAINNLSERYEEWFLFFSDVSAARCARVSYRNHDNTDCVIEKDIQLADTLRKSKHFTPFEHQAIWIGETAQNTANFRGWQSRRIFLERDGK